MGELARVMAAVRRFAVWLMPAGRPGPGEAVWAGAHEVRQASSGPCQRGEHARLTILARDASILAASFRIARAHTCQPLISSRGTCSSGIGR